MRHVLVILAAFTAWSCQSVSQVATPAAELQARDLPVLRLVVEDVAQACMRRDPERVVLVEALTNFGVWDGSTGAAVHYGFPVGEKPVDVTWHLEERNAAAYDLRPMAPLPQGSQLVTHEAVRDALGRKGNWSRFRRAFPSAYGVARISAPGFSTDGSRVGVLVSVYCGELCGWGALVLLEDVGGEWKIVRRYGLWES